MFREDRKGMPGKCCSIIQNVVMMDVHYIKILVRQQPAAPTTVQYWPTTGPHNTADIVYRVNSTAVKMTG